MNEVVSIGTPPWTRAQMLEHLEEFAALYAERPIRDNQGGMKSPHMFAVWFMAKMLSPDLIVESGIFKGQSTWLLEKACPEARLISIDPCLEYREYISNRATYTNKDFSEQDWKGISDRSLVFFDDHQNAYKRLQQCDWFGFKHIIFEDNYPASQGDCYSLKKAFSHAGFAPENSKLSHSSKSVRAKVGKKLAKICGIKPLELTPQYDSVKVAPNDCDAAMLRRHLDVYEEFPPIIQREKTRWGDDWAAPHYPTPEPLLTDPAHPLYATFAEEAAIYTWICYARLK